MTDTDPTSPAAPSAEAEAQPAPPIPGEQRRLAHPPSDRYRAAEARAAAAEAAKAEDPSASVVRGLVLATIVALLGALVMVVLGGVAAVTTGLMVVAGLIGFGVGLALQFGAGRHLSSGRRVRLAIGLTVAAIALAQVGIWQYALAEGGVLPLVDYLAEVYGLLVPGQLVVGTVVAWVAAR